jgi:hypothetical protein
MTTTSEDGVKDTPILSEGSRNVILSLKNQHTRGQAVVLPSMGIETMFFAAPHQRMYQFFASMSGETRSPRRFPDV